MEQTQILERFQKDSEWFYKNIDSLRNQGFVGNFVAIKDSKPIASGKDVNVVIDELDKNGEDSSLLFIEFVYPEGFTLIL
jgi:hypothetical protein